MVNRMKLRFRLVLKLLKKVIFQKSTYSTAEMLTRTHHSVAGSY
jgi:hypothetical protein